jgi:hypothetical protein
MNNKMSNIIIHCIKDRYKSFVEPEINKFSSYFYNHKFGEIILNNIDITNLGKDYEELSCLDDDFCFQYGFEYNESKGYKYILYVSLIGPFALLIKNTQEKKRILLNEKNIDMDFEKELFNNVKKTGFFFLEKEILLQRINLNMLNTESNIMSIFHAVFSDSDNFPFSCTEEELKEYEKHIIDEKTYKFDPAVVEDFKKTENYKKWEKWLFKTTNTKVL